MSIIGDGNNIKLTVRDKKNSGSNSYSIDCGETTHVFQFNLKVDNLKLSPGDYDVIISSKNLAQFTSHSRPIVYYIVLNLHIIERLSSNETPTLRTSEPTSMNVSTHARRTVTQFSTKTTSKSGLTFYFVRW